MNNQQILIVKDDYVEVDRYLKESGYNKILLVCGKSIKKMKIDNYFLTLEARLKIKVVRFNDFLPNPKYESVKKGVKLLNAERCKLIVAVGGGSAIDVAKCIKLFSNMDHNKNYLEQAVSRNDIELMAIPTTAGTGSEATHFAVIYSNGKKHSIADESCIPSTVIFDYSTLKTLPEYQRKVTMLDALCHAIESYWSINSTEESKKYAGMAIKKIFENIDAYMLNTDVGNMNMLDAANIAGKAINISQTTVAHAMSYKLTSMYGIAHGHAVAICMKSILPYIAHNTDKCIDVRGTFYLERVLTDISKSMGCSNVDDAIIRFNDLISKLSLKIPVGSKEDCIILKESVNLQRLKNSPIVFDKDTIGALYHKILCIK